MFVCFTEIISIFAKILIQTVMIAMLKKWIIRRKKIRRHKKSLKRTRELLRIYFSHPNAIPDNAAAFIDNIAFLCPTHPKLDD